MMYDFDYTKYEKMNNYKDTADMNNNEHTEEMNYYEDEEEMYFGEVAEDMFFDNIDIPRPRLDCTNYNRRLHHYKIYNTVQNALYKLTESDDGDNRDNDIIDEIGLALSMFEGKTKLDKSKILAIFEKLYNWEIMQFLAHNDYYNICDDKDFILDLIEHSGATCEIACYATDRVIKQILEDKELLEKIYTEEVLKKANLSGAENLSVFISQLVRCDELNNYKDFMMDLIKNVMDIKNIGTQYDDLICDSMNFVFIEKCEELFKDKEFTENVFKFLENIEKGIKYENDYILGLAEIMLKTPELSSNRDLAFKYISNFATCKNIDKSLFENEDFLNCVLDELGESSGGFELPLNFYSDEIIVEKYLKSCDGIEKINFNLNYKVFSDKFEEIFEESMSSVMMNAISEAIENNKMIVISDDESLKSKDVIKNIQQWAEDNDLIKIGDKLHIVKVSKGEVIDGQVNIGNGERGKNTIKYNYTGYSYEPTIVLDGDMLENTLKQIGGNNKIDEEQEFVDEIFNLVNQKKALHETEKQAKDLLEQYENINENNKKSLNDK